MIRESCLFAYISMLNISFTETLLIIYKYILLDLIVHLYQNDQIENIHNKYKYLLKENSKFCQ